MQVQTTRFGEIDVPENAVIQLPDGVLGFPGVERFILLEHDSEGTPFKWLQALDEPGLAFIVIDPHLVVEGYEVEFDDETAETTGAKRIDAENFAMMAIVNVPQDKPIEMTVNLRAPVIVRMKDRTGWQIVLPNEEYPIRHRLFSETPAEEKTEPNEPKSE